MNFDLNESLALLERTPQVLKTLLQDLSATWTQSDYGSGTWSVHQVVGHLLWGEQTDWIARAERILEHGEERAFEPFDRNGHASLCQEHRLNELLEMFAEARAKNLQTLRAMNLSGELFSKGGRHPALGPVTMSQLLATWTVHDLNHIAQICKAMAFQYRAAVGPWEQYLSILAPTNPR